LELLGERASELGLPAPAMSGHFCARDARVRIYALKAGAMPELKGWLGRA
jgi:hypothetical protein